MFSLKCSVIGAEPLSCLLNDDFHNNNYYNYVLIQPSVNCLNKCSCESTPYIN